MPVASHGYSAILCPLHSEATKWRRLVPRKVVLAILFEKCSRQYRGTTNGQESHLDHVPFYRQVGRHSLPYGYLSCGLIQTALSWNATPPTGATGSEPVRLFTPTPPI